MRKITLDENTPTPKVINPSGRIFENAMGGPYKYGFPIEVNAESLRRLHSRSEGL